MLYHSTRNSSEKISSKEAILRGLAPDGGLYVPEEIPKIDDLDELRGLDYKSLAEKILSLWLTDFSKGELSDAVNSAYDEKFDTEEIAPLKRVSDRYFLELYHGPTSAFKDMALSILPYLMTSAQKAAGKGEEIIILTATSGDTGKAALEGFKNVPKTRICVFFPEEGVSDVQKLQMRTQEGQNVLVCGLKGDFDDCQTGVKKLFEDEEIKRELKEKNMTFSSANSINIGRLIPQICYYFWAYFRALDSGLEDGKKLSFIVPTGNFGNILASYYAKNMGLPIENIVCASNDNRVLTDVLRTGEYDRNRDIYLTASPSMDILVSSNFERYIWHVSEDQNLVIRLMNSLEEKGIYQIPEDVLKKMDILGYSSDQDESFEEIKRVYEEDSYLIDTHTAVASSCANKFRNEKGGDDMVIVSTASPYKFSADVLKALEKDQEGSWYDQAHRLEDLTGTDIPKNIEALNGKVIRHDNSCEKDLPSMRQVILEFIND